MLDTMSWVRSGFKKLEELPEANVDLRLKNHTALDSLLNGDATYHDLDVLIGVSNMAMALARVHGADWKEEVRAGADALEAVQKRAGKWRKVQATPAEQDAIKMLYRIHEAQLDACRVVDLDNGIAIVKKHVGVMK